MRATDQTPKVTLPSPGLFANFWSPERSHGAYASLAAFLEDVARILREEVEELAEYGATYIQLDAPHYPLLFDPKTRAFYEAQGWSTEEWLDLGVALDNKVMAGIDGVTFGLHLCRGNQGSRWLVSGGYGPIAERYSSAPRRTGCCSSTTTPVRVGSSRCSMFQTTRWSCWA